jgi:histidinol dehydrogenase
MKIISRNTPDFDKCLVEMLRRDAFSPEIDNAVAEIISDVRARNDSALQDYLLKFDKVLLMPHAFKVPEDVIDEAKSELQPEVIRAIDQAVDNIQDFYGRCKPRDWEYSPRPGVTLGEQFHPLDRVGCYIPGGTAPLISTVCHTVAIAAAAGVKEIIVCTPPQRGGSVNPAILYASRRAGATAVYRLGGVYAIAAMAYGTESVPRVEKICGPGNAYVAAAKRQIYGNAALDLVAGPSEIMIVADSSANPAFVAADILSQAEHGSGREHAVLVSTDRKLIDEVQAEIVRQSALLTRQECVAKVLENGVFLVEAADLEDAARIASLYAPEHLELLVENPRELAPKITASGAIFMGQWTPEPVGDYIAGPSHVLPTGGTGRFFNGLTMDAFYRRTSLIHYEQDALMRELPDIEVIASCEGLDAHRRSASIRRDGV